MFEMFKKQQPPKPIKPTNESQTKPSQQPNKIKPRMSNECEGKSSWPELLGEDGEKAKRIIEEENPLVTAIIVGPDSTVITDFRCDRVWVWVDAEGKVIRVPSIG